MNATAYPINPLTAAHCRSLAEVLRDFPALKATYEAYERCGLNCRQDLEQLEAQYNICTSIRTEFDPKAPPVQNIPPATATNPFTPSHCRTMDQVIERYPSLKATFEAYQRCGIECADQLKSLEAMYEVCSAFKREFRPNEV